MKWLMGLGGLIYTFRLSQHRVNRAVVLCLAEKKNYSTEKIKYSTEKKNSSAEKKYARERRKTLGREVPQRRKTAWRSSISEEHFTCGPPYHSPISIVSTRIGSIVLVSQNDLKPFILGLGVIPNVGVWLSVM